MVCLDLYGNCSSWAIVCGQSLIIGSFYGLAGIVVYVYT